MNLDRVLSPIHWIENKIPNRVALAIIRVGRIVYVAMIGWLTLNILNGSFVTFTGKMIVLIILTGFVFHEWIFIVQTEKIQGEVPGV